MRHLLFPAITALFFGILYAWAIASIPWCRSRRRLTAALLAGLFVSEIALRQIELTWHVATTPALVGEVIVMTIVLTALPLGALRVAMTLLERVRPAPAPKTDAPAAMTRRQLVEASAGAAMLAGTGSMIGWGMIRGRDAYEIDEIAVRIAGLPRALDGYVIAQISDIHTGDYVGERMLDEGFERVRQAKADLLVVTGDVVDSDAAFAPLFARKLAAVAPRDGIFACLGNHDYYAGAREIIEVLRAAGIRTLVNEGLLVRPGDGGGFALLGVDDQWSRRYRGPGARLDLAIAQVPAAAPRVLLSHQPPTVDRWAGQVALQLSGHTHGGQINPLGLRPADVFFKYVSGRYQAGQTTLYVNRGFGTVGPPARVGAPPEVTRIVLVAA